jgi:hypothetical protein
MIKVLAAAFIGKALLASFEYRQSSPLALFPGNLPAVETVEPFPAGNPALLPLFQCRYVASSVSNPYSMEGLSGGSLSAGGGTGVLGIQASWNRFGTDFYSENVLKADAGFRPVRFFSIGTGYRYYILDISTEDISLTTSLSGAAASLLFMPADFIYLTFLQENIRSLRDKRRRDLLFPDSAAGIAVRPLRGLWFSYNIEKTVMGYVNSFSLSASLLSFFRIKGGYSRETASYSAAVSVRYRSFSLSYGFRYHSYLRATHSIGLTISTGKTPYEGMNYLSLKKSDTEGPVKKIDIRNCSREELKKVPVVSDTIAGRIIKYRSMIGPVTEKALVQVGVPSEDISELRKHICGLAKSDDYRKKKKRKPRIYHAFGRKKTLSSRRKIFRKLMATGIGATASLRLSEIYVSGRRKEIAAYLESLPSLTPEKKKEILALCSQ